MVLCQIGDRMKNEKKNGVLPGWPPFSKFKKEMVELLEDAQEPIKDDLEIVRDSLLGHIAKTEKHFSKIEEQHNKTEKHFSKIEEQHNKTEKHFSKIEEQHNKTEKHFSKIEEQHNKTEKHLNKIEEQHNKTEKHLKVIETALTNHVTDTNKKVSKLEKRFDSFDTKLDKLLK